MKTHLTGRESSLIEDIKLGRKTIDVRLAKPRFKAFRVGDRIRLREDVWKGSQIVTSRPTGITVEITKIEKFPSFKKMLATIDLKKALPSARTKKEALALYRKFYPEEEEAKFGVIAFHFRLIK